MPYPPSAQDVQTQLTGNTFHHLRFGGGENDPLRELDAVHPNGRSVSPPSQHRGWYRSCRTDIRRTQGILGGRGSQWSTPEGLDAPPPRGRAEPIRGAIAPACPASESSSHVERPHSASIPRTEDLDLGFTSTPPLLVVAALGADPNRALNRGDAQRGPRRATNQSGVRDRAQSAAAWSYR